MAKLVRYLRQVPLHLEDKYGAEKANAIMEKALKRYDELIDENRDEPREYYMHIRLLRCLTRCWMKESNAVRLKLL